MSQAITIRQVQPRRHPRQRRANAAGEFDVFNSRQHMLLLDDRQLSIAEFVNDIITGGARIARR